MSTFTKTIDRFLARLVYWYDLVFGEKHPLAFFGNPGIPIAQKTGLIATQVELSRRDARREDRAYMGKLLLICIRNKRWRRAKRIVAFADKGSQRQLLTHFIEDGKMEDVKLVMYLTRIELTVEEFDFLAVRAALHIDYKRLPEDGRRILIDRLTPQQDGLEVATLPSLQKALGPHPDKAGSLKDHASHLAKKFREDPTTIRYH